MAKTVKFKRTENVTPEKIVKAIECLNTGGTKRAACDILGISYNTPRLQKIIDEFNYRNEIEAKMRDKKKGTNVDKKETLDIIKSYLECGSVDRVAKDYYRTPHIINKVLEIHGAKLHSAKVDYFKPPLLPDICMADSFAPGEMVWSARYNMLALIRKEYEPGVYAIKVLGKYERDAYQAIEDLGSLKHLEELGINLKTLRIEEPERKDSD